MALNIVEAIPGKFVVPNFRNIYAIVLWAVSALLVYLGASEGPPQTPVQLACVIVGVVLVFCGTFFWFTRTTVELVPEVNRYRVVQAGMATVDADTITDNVHIRIVADKVDFVDAVLVVKSRQFVAGCWGDQATAHQELKDVARKLSVQIRNEAKPSTAGEGGGSK